MAKLKIHIRINKTRHFSACGQAHVPDERIAKFAEDVTCYHCQRIAVPLPTRAGRAALANAAERQED